MFAWSQRGQVGRIDSACSGDKPLRMENDEVGVWISLEQ